MAGSYPFPFFVRMCSSTGSSCVFKNSNVSNQQRNIVPIDRPIITQAEFFEDHARHEQIFDPFLELVGEMHRASARDRFDKPPRFFVKPRVHRDEW